MTDRQIERRAPRDLLIRPALETDLLTLEWEGEYSRFRRVYAEVFQRTGQGIASMWVAELPDVGIVGQAFVQFNARSTILADGFRRAYVHSVRVRPAYRRLGLASQIMQTLEADLVTRGYQQVMLNVVGSNTAGLEFYKYLGYRVIGKDPGNWSYYDENSELRRVNEPGWQMLKDLDTSQ